MTASVFASLDIDDLAELNLAEVQPIFARSSVDLATAGAGAPLSSAANPRRTNRHPPLAELIEIVEAAATAEASPSPAAGHAVPCRPRAAGGGLSRHPSFPESSVSASASWVAAAAAAAAASRATVGCQAARDDHLAVDRNILSFSVYPTTLDDLEGNRFLWKIAHDAEFDHDACIRSTGLPQPFAVVIPRTLYHFLRSVSLHEMHHCVLSLLAEVAVDDEGYGIAVMESELEPSVYAQLQDLLQHGPNPGSALTQVADKVSPIIDELLLQMSGLEPWKIHAQVMYLDPTPEDPEWAPVDDQALLDPRVYHDIYTQWCFYLRRLRPILPEVHISFVLDQFVQLVYAGKQGEVIERAFTMLLGSKRKGTLLNLLPRDLVQQKLIPEVFLRGFQTSEDLARPPISKYRYRFPSSKTGDEDETPQQLNQTFTS